MHVALKIATYDRTFWVFQYSVGPLVSQIDLSGEPKLAFRFKWWFSKLHGRFAFLSCLCRYIHNLIYTLTPRQTYCHYTRIHTHTHTHTHTCTNITNTFLESSAHILTYDTRRRRYNPFSYHFSATSFVLLFRTSTTRHPVLIHRSRNGKCGKN